MPALYEPGDRAPGLWFCKTTTTTAADAAVRLVCFAHAGGTPSIFLNWSAHLGVHVQVVPVLLPGRGLRLRERPATEIGPLARDIASALIEQDFLGTYAVFGHSMGALLAYETVCELRNRKAPSPAHLFVSGSRPPHLYGPSFDVAHLSDDALLQAVRAIGGFLGTGATAGFERRLPTLRADLTACETYRWTSRPPLACPITTFSAAGDPIATPDQVRQWRAYTSATLRHLHLPGGHFYLSGPHRTDLLHVLRGELAGFADLRKLPL